MKPYIFGERNGVHIIDLSQTVPLFARALDFVRQTVAAAARCCSSAPSARRRSRSPRPRAVRASISSTTAGWAACSPTGRPSRARSSASRALEEQLSGDTARPHQEGSPPADPRARQARAVARRHPRHGRHSRRDVRDRRQQGRAGDQGSQRARHSGRRDPRFQRQPAAASPSRFRATTTPAARSASTATRWPRRRRAGSRARQAARGVDIGAMDEPPVEEARARAEA